MHRETEHNNQGRFGLWDVIERGVSIICTLVVIGLILGAIITGNWFLALLAIFPAPFIPVWKNSFSARQEEDLFHSELDGVTDWSTQNGSEFSVSSSNLNHQNYEKAYHPPP